MEMRTNNIGLWWLVLLGRAELVRYSDILLCFLIARFSKRWLRIAAQNSSVSVPTIVLSGPEFDSNQSTSTPLYTAIRATQSRSPTAPSPMLYA